MQMPHEPLVLAEGALINLPQRVCERLKAGDFFEFILRRRSLLQKGDALPGRLEGGRGTREERLLHSHSLKLLLLPAAVLSSLGERNLQQRAIRGLFFY